ncbi:MAG TPA: glutamate synthase [bacterium]
MKSNPIDQIRRVMDSRRRLLEELPPTIRAKSEEEGGCGVTGFACTIPVAGRHIFTPSVQMHNRGNGKGGGIAAVGLDPDQLGVSRDVLESHFCLQVAALDPACMPILKEKYVDQVFDIAAHGMLPTVKDWRELPSLEVRPPDVHRFFVRVKPALLDAFIAERGLQALERGAAEEEFVYQNSMRLNAEYYASQAGQKAFVVSQGRNMLVLKIVGYAEDVVRYYRMDDFKAHVWIAHQRYPTKGRVWHPGGAHPFAGLDDALVHNGDFANYQSVADYLRQRGLRTMFMTDTEVSILVFDYLSRVHGYPLEYIIEALAPTSELDFDLLPKEKQQVYRQIQVAHIHGSPDGPWFFIIARNRARARQYQLLGITDTAMLRPQVFAVQNGEVQTGLVCSEKQAIDATLKSLAAEDKRFCPVADKYWNARGGSSRDGGAFIFTVQDDPASPTGKTLTCTDKFGSPVTTPPEQVHCDVTLPVCADAAKGDVTAAEIRKHLAAGAGDRLAGVVLKKIKDWDFDALRRFCDDLACATGGRTAFVAPAINALTALIDTPCHTGLKKRASVLQILHLTLHAILDAVPPVESRAKGASKRVAWKNRRKLRKPAKGETTLVIDATGFEPELENRDSLLIVEAHKLGWKRFITYNLTGQRFHGVGLGPDTQDVRIDLYDSSGDYEASGIDGLTMHIHGNAQDQLGQIMKAGKLVVHGDVGQTFMYGAKGGEVYIRGNAAGRPLINAVGKPRVVINGTCLDYLAESFMAGNPLAGGGFVVLNGLEYDAYGAYSARWRPYPGGNLFSLASGGAIYLRDPEHKTVAEQLNGGHFLPMTHEDWALIKPYLVENEKLFGIKVDDLLTHNGRKLEPTKIYRKVGAMSKAAAAKVVADDDVNLGPVKSLEAKAAARRKKGAA